MKTTLTLTAQIFFVFAFITLSSLGVFFTALGKVLRVSSQKFTQYSLLAEKISNYFQKQENDDVETLGETGYTINPLLSNEKVYSMAIKAFEHFQQVPRVRDISSFYDISDRQALKIREVIVKEFETQLPSSDPIPVYYGTVLQA